MLTQPPDPTAVSRRSVLRRGAKLVYVAPAILASVQAAACFNASGSTFNPPR